MRSANFDATIDTTSNCYETTCFSKNMEKNNNKD